MRPKPIPSIDTSLDPATLGGPALEALRDELFAIDERDLLSLNVEVSAAATLIIGAAPVIRRHRAALVAQFGEQMTGAALDRLDLLARAALQAHAAYRALESGTDVQQLSADVVKYREVLVAEVRTLVLRGVLSRGLVGELNGTKGFRNQYLDLMQLTAVLTEHWDTVEPQTGLELAYVQQAEAAAHALVDAIGARSLASQSPAAELRQRAFTLMASTYDDARRLISFLRWKRGDADRIAPSLYAGRSNGRRSRPTEGTDLDVVEPTPDVTPSPDEPGGDPFAGT